MPGRVTEQDVQGGVHELAQRLRVADGHGRVQVELGDRCALLLVLGGGRGREGPGVQEGRVGDRDDLAQGVGQHRREQVGVGAGQVQEVCRAPGVDAPPQDAHVPGALVLRPRRPLGGAQLGVQGLVLALAGGTDLEHGGGVRLRAVGHHDQRLAGRGEVVAELGLEAGPADLGRAVEVELLHHANLVRRADAAPVRTRGRR